MRERSKKSVTVAEASPATLRGSESFVRKLVAPAWSALALTFVSMAIYLLLRTSIRQELRQELRQEFQKEIGADNRVDKTTPKQPLRTELGSLEGRLEILERETDTADAIERVGALAEQVAKLEKLLEHVRNKALPKLNNTTTETDKQLATMQGLVAQVEREVSGLSKKITSTSTRVAQLKGSLSAMARAPAASGENEALVSQLQSEVARLSQQIRGHDGILASFREKVVALQTGLRRASAMLGATPTQVEVDELEHRVQELESTPKIGTPAVTTPRVKRGRRRTGGIFSTVREGLRLTVKKVDVAGSGLTLSFLIESLSGSVSIDTNPAVIGINYQPSSSRVVLSSGVSLRMRNSGVVGRRTHPMRGLTLKLTEGVPMAFYISYTSVNMDSATTAKLLEVSLRRNGRGSTKFSFKDVPLGK